MRHFVFLPLVFLAGALSALASVDSGLLSLVPAGARIVASVDVTRARNSEFGQYLLSKAQTEDAHFQEMMDQTGFDPRRDLQSIVFETSGPETAGMPHSFAILARGNFDASRIREMAKAKGAMFETYQGVDMIVHRSGGKEQTAIGFPEVGVAVMADIDSLKQIIDNRASPVALDAELKSKISSIGSGNDAWYASLAGGSFLGDHAGKDMAPQAKALQGIVQSSGGVKLGSIIEASLDAVTRSAQDSQSLADVVRFLTSMVQMQRQKDPRAGILASALDGMTLQNSGTSVHVAISIPEKSLEQLAEVGPLAMRAHQNK